MGHWYEPCKWDNYTCHSKIETATANEWPPDLVENHMNSGAWLHALQQHNRITFSVWLLASSVCFSLGFFGWKRTKRDNCFEAICHHQMQACLIGIAAARQDVGSVRLSHQKM